MPEHARMVGGDPLMRSLITAFVLLGLCGCGAAPRSAIPPQRVLGEFALAEPDAAANEVAAGLAVEVAVRGLTYPTSLEIGDEGEMYLAEAGAVPGDAGARARVLRIARNGSTTVVADRLAPPVTDLLWHDGRLFISHRGAISVLEAGTVREVVGGLPSQGDHANNQLTAGPDGYLYLGQGTATNAGVVGPDNAWLPQQRSVRDVPAKAVVLRDLAFVASDPADGATAKTGAFQPFATASGAITVPGAIKANGAILRFKPDGSGLEAYAWGLRNPCGLQWTPEGRLYASDDGFDERGSRPIANAPDVVWDIRRDAWYGWPDYAGGDPVIDRHFRPTAGVQPDFLLKEHPPVAPPVLRLEAHSGVAKLGVIPAGFSPDGTLLLARFGALAPPVGDEQSPTGRDVLVIDPRDGGSRIFLRARRESLGSGEFAHTSGPGLKRPVDVVWDARDQVVYVVDLGAVATTAGAKPRPFPGSGVVWRVKRVGARTSFPPDLCLDSEHTPTATRPGTAGSASGGEPLAPSKRPLDESDRLPLEPLPAHPVETARPGP